MLNPSWKILQFNCNKNQLATAEIEGRFVGNLVDIALIQEPQLADNAFMGCRVKKIPGTLAIQSSNSFSRPGARAAIYVRDDIGKAIKLIVMEQFSNRDIVTVQLELDIDNELKKMFICSLYCPRLNNEGNLIHDPTLGKLREAVSFANQNRIPILIGADANAHNERWGGTRTDSRGLNLEEFCSLEGQLQILNMRGAITYDRIGLNAASSSIDVTLCSDSIATRLTNWNVHLGFCGSDHRPISLELLATKPPTGKVQIKSSTNWKKFEKITRSSLSGLSSVFTNAVSSEGLDLAAYALGRTLRHAHASSTKSRNVTSRFRREWYSRELDEQRKKINRLQSKVKRTQNRGSESEYQVALIEFKLEKNSYKKNCSKQKLKKWKEMAEGLDELKDSARLQKLLEKRASSSMGTIRRPDGTYTQTIEDTQEELMRTHLPGCIRLDDAEQTPDDRLTAADILDLTSASYRIRMNHLPRPVTQGESATLERSTQEIVNMTAEKNIEWAIKSFKPNKAPGPDGITPKMLQMAGDSIFEPLKLLFSCSAKLGHIPEEWSSASVAFIPKAGKTSYDDTSAYRAISLMSFVLKTMEKLVDNKLRKVDGLDNKLHPAQHAYREGKSTATALDDAATILENCLAKGGKALGLYLDIKGAFDQTAYTITTSSLEELGVENWTVSWIKGLLGNRKLQPAIKGSPRRYRPVMGLPQGGCSSPLGWIACADSLVRKLAEANFKVIAFADDFKIIMTKKKNETDFLTSKAIRALRIVTDWCNNTGLSVNPNKVGLVEFYRGRKRIKNADKIDFLGNRLVPTPYFKFLGVFFDRKLNWNFHIEQALEKGRKTVMVTAQYLRFSWGPLPRAAMHIMNQIVVPRVLYGCGVWWHRAQLKRHSEKLDKLQRLMLRMVTGVFHTTPTADILRIFDLGSLSLRAMKLALDENQRLTEAGGRARSTNTKEHRSIETLFSQLMNGNRQSDSIKRTWNTQRSYRAVVNTREDWQVGLETTRFTDIWYSDGSKKDDLVGVGACNNAGSVEISIRLSGHATIMQAETIGIRICAEQLAEASPGRKILIQSDSQAAIKALDNPVIRTETVRKCAEALNSLARENEVVLGWIPGHSNHPGNDKADRLANEGAEKPEIDLEVPEASSSKAFKITEWEKTQKKNEWLAKRPDNGEYAKTLIDKLRDGNKLLAKSRMQIRARISIITGHARTNKYLLRAKGEGDGLCRFCSSAYEDVKHLLKDCRRLDRIRRDIIGHTMPNDDQLAQAGLEKLVRYSKEASFFDMLACDLKVT